MNHRKNSKNISKGAPSGFALSLLVHAGAFMLAGMLVVFNVVKKEEKKFVPPKAVERPKMKLKKPKVKVKKTAMPKPTTRIVTKVKRANMPDIRLPEMSGIGDGLAGDIGGFDSMPDLSEITIFGAGQSFGNDFVGTFYDFKRGRNGRSIPMSDAQFVDELIKFTSSGWRKSKLSRFYRSPKKLYATSITVPLIRSAMAPTAFGEGDTVAWAWMVHYEGDLTYHEDIKFRFWGQGDDVMVVRVAGETVLNACKPDDNRGTPLIGGKWQSSATKNRQYRLGNNLAVIGDWIELKAGEPLDMEIIIGEVSGGAFCSYLLVEVDGVEYERNRQFAPILPIFKTEEPSHDLIDTISQHLIQTEATITGGPVFKDYASSERSPDAGVATDVPEPVIPVEVEPASSVRLWTKADGTSLEADFMSLVSGNVILKTPKGRQVKIPAADLSEEDVRYVELARPPDMNITFIKSSSQRSFAVSPYLNARPPKVLAYVFGAKMKQTSSFAYNHELKVEFFAVGQSFLEQNEYGLLDYQVSTFTPTRENKRSHRFAGEEVELIEFEAMGQRRGLRYAENMVIITDERGEVVAQSASAKWLSENLENLRAMPVGGFMDKTCKRIVPTGPKPTTF